MAWIAAAAGYTKPGQDSERSAAPATSGSPADQLSSTAADSVMKKRYSAAQLKREVSQPVKREASQTIAIAEPLPAEGNRHGNPKRK